MMKKPAFTLIEMVIAVTVFTLFMGLAMGVYLNFHDVQRETAVERQIMLEMESVMNVAVQAVKERDIDYEYYNEGRVLDPFSFDRTGLAANLVSGDTSGMNKSELALDDWLLEWDSEAETLSLTMDGQTDLMHSPDTRVSYANFRIFPSENPYENVLDSDVQYQPHVKIELEFTRTGELREELSMDLQTTVTSRSYQ